MRFCVYTYGIVYLLFAHLYLTKNFSYISGISLLGLPAEMYTFGTQYWMIIGSECFVSVTMALVYLPVFYKLQITSSYEVCIYYILYPVYVFEMQYYSYKIM